MGQPGSYLKTGVLYFSLGEKGCSYIKIRVRNTRSNDLTMVHVTYCGWCTRLRAVSARAHLKRFKFARDSPMGHYD